MVSAQAETVKARRSAKLPKLGLTIDAGVPDGANFGVMFRPWRYLRASVAGGHNAISPGVRGGLTLVMLPAMIAPTLTLEGGHYFEGDANATLKMFGVTSDSAVLKEIGYNYANAHLGLELGQKHFTFYIHGGMSWLQTKLHNIDEDLNEQLMDSDVTVTIKEDPTITLIGPSAKMGLVYYF